MYYRFDSTINSTFEASIHQAINTLSKLTCIHFAPRTNERDFITFRSKSDDGCSSHVGYAGGEQIIKIGPRCNRQHTILHEICHSLGVWHEQSRPDRDDYLEVLINNVESGREHNFLKHTIFEVDSQGQNYDYASVMHYRLDSFNKVDGLDTLKITNPAEYARQGRPDLGRVPTLSKSDVTQINRLYNCPGTGLSGRLSLDIQAAEGLPAKDDPYVSVTAYDDQGRSETKSTNFFNDVSSPIWNEKLRFGMRTNWQYVNVSIWDHDDTSSDDLLTTPQTFSINPGQRNFQHCDNIICHQRLTFSMSFTEVCNCFNGGSCLPDRTCACSPGFGGPRCQYLRGKLHITVHRAKKLFNADETSISDPFVVVQVYDHNGGITERRTRIIKENLSPVWKEALRFGVNEWSWFTLQVFDDDGSNGVDRLGYAYTYVLDSFATRRRQTMKALYNGTVSFGLVFKP